MSGENDGEEFILNIDADPMMADWPKANWRLPPYKSSEFMQQIAAEGLTLESFRNLPVYQFAVRRGLIVNDEWTGLQNLPLTLNYSWEPVLSEGLPYTFPQPFRAPSYRGPAVYRWLVREPESRSAPLAYIGETDDLARRVYGYLHPGPSQRTNQRIYADFKDRSAEGSIVALQVVRLRDMVMESSRLRQADLGQAWVRRLLENLFLGQHALAGYTLLNAGLD